MSVGAPGHGSSGDAASRGRVRAEQAADRDVEAAPDELVGEPDVVGVEPAGRVDDQQRRVRRRSRTAPDAEQDRVGASGRACEPLHPVVGDAGRTRHFREVGRHGVGRGHRGVRKRCRGRDRLALRRCGRRVARAAGAARGRRHDDEQQAGHRCRHRAATHARFAVTSRGRYPIPSPFTARSASAVRTALATNGPTTFEPLSS